MTSRQLRRIWLRENKRRAAISAIYAAKFYRALKSDTDGYLKAFKEGGDRLALTYANNLLMSAGITRVMNELYSKAGARAARLAYDEQIQQKAFNTLADWFTEILNYLSTDFYNKGTLRISETTRSILIDVTDKAITEGWGYDETAKYFNEVMPQINRNRAEMIARTETAKAIHAGTYVGANKSPFEKQKVWVSAQDNRTRGNPFEGQQDKADHYHMNGQTVDFNDKFFDSRSNIFLNHPHDKEAPAKDVINCRCSFSVISKRDANGRLIRKL